MKNIFCFFVLVLLYATRVFADVNGSEGNGYLDFSTGKSAYFKLLGLDSDISSDKTVYSEFPELYDPSVVIAIFDGGFYEEHEELNALLKVSYRDKTHGTLTSSIIMAEAGNDKGFRGIVNPSGQVYGIGFNEISGHTSFHRAAYIKKFCKYFDVVNFSVTFSVKSYRYTKDDFIFKDHLKEMKYFRSAFEAPECSKTLFVLSAGNSDVDAQKENGGIHYVWESSKAVYRPLSNVIVVSSHRGKNSSGEYTATQDYGRSVDIYTEEKLTGPRSYISGYSTRTMYGTSYSAPIISGVASMIAGIPFYKDKPSTIKQALLNSGQKKQAFKGSSLKRPILNAYTIIDDIY